MTSQGSLSVNHQETARRPAGWPSDKPVWSLTVFFLAALVVPGRIILEYAQHWSDLGSHYLPQYVVSGLGSLAGPGQVVGRVCSSGSPNRLNGRLNCRCRIF